MEVSKTSSPVQQNYIVKKIIKLVCLNSRLAKKERKAKPGWYDPYVEPFILVGQASLKICFDDGGNLMLSDNFSVVGSQQVLPLYDEPLQVALVFCVPFLVAFQPPLPSWLLLLASELQLQSLLGAVPVLLRRVWLPVPLFVCWPLPRYFFAQVLFDA